MPLKIQNPLMNDDIPFRIALGLTPGIGHQIARYLITLFDSAQKVYQLSDQQLTEIPGINQHIAKNLFSHQHLIQRAQQEVKFMEKHGIRYLGFDDPEFPKLLNECVDAPYQLFCKGEHQQLERKNIAIVGTRKATNYGKGFTEALMQKMAQLPVNIISGLAYGIDICAHNAALKNGLNTFGVVAHGLDRIYPYAHKNTAQLMTKQGGLITEFLSETNPDRENFPKRNRIIAGLSDATLVIEAADKGGALITADIAFSYDRNVFALPGGVTQSMSKGCNQLIAQQKAQLITDVDQLIECLEITPNEMPVQTQLFPDLNDNEMRFMTQLQEGVCSTELLCNQLKLAVHHINQIAFQLELKGLIKKLPGNQFMIKTAF